MNEDDTFKRLRQWPFKDAEDYLCKNIILSDIPNLPLTLDNAPPIVEELLNKTGWTLNEFFGEWDKEKAITRKAVIKYIRHSRLGNKKIK